jgi:hypothetical protein
MEWINADACGLGPSEVLIISNAYIKLFTMILISFLNPLSVLMKPKKFLKFEYIFFNLI